MKKNLCILFVSLLAGLVFISCSKTDNASGIPTSLAAGDEIILSSMSPLGHGFFRVLSSSTGQWAQTSQPTISPSYSSATYAYQLTGDNTARLSSNDRQSLTGRSWIIMLDLTFDTPNSGSYQLKDIATASGVSYTTKGTFTLNNK